jgi:hypothetical protein
MMDLESIHDIQSKERLITYVDVIVSTPYFIHGEYARK